MQVTFHPDATATMVHDESVMLPQELGHITASPQGGWIDFNEHRQVWELRLDPHADDPVFSHASRQACVAWEIEHFNSVLA